jgi:hypothetical protein
MTRPFAIIVVALVASTWALYLLAQGFELAWSFLGPFSLAVGVLTSAGFLFRHWAWHWPVLHLLTKTPRLTGTWVGKLQSDYIQAGEKESRPPVRVALVVTQLADSLNVRQYTPESSSTSVAASVSEEPGQRFTLATVYFNEPELPLQQSRSPMHYGATRLMIHGRPRKPTKLEGSYWTTRNTSGTLEFKLVSRTRAHSFREALAFEQTLPSLLTRVLRRFARGKAGSS